MIAATGTHPYESRFPDIFKPSFFRRFKSAIFIGCGILYALYAWWFFAIGDVMGRANWTIAGSYMADWVTYEVRPDISVRQDGTMRITYPRFTPLGDNPNPDWLRKSSEMREVVPDAPKAITGTAPVNKSTGLMAPGAQLGGGFVAVEPKTIAPFVEEVVSSASVSFSASKTLTVENKLVTVSDGIQTLVARMEPGNGVFPQGPLPSFATQREPGSKIILSLGFAGWGEIEDAKVKIRKRFFGWANFLFDTASPYHGKSLTEVVNLIMSGERLDPKQSNLSLAIDNVLYNGEWQHLDVWTKLLQTIVMAFVGTLFATIIAFPLAFLAARNVTRNRFFNQVTKRFFDFLRSVDMLIWALFFTRGFGPGPLAGISAIFFTDTGSLGKLYSEALENIDDKQREGVRSVGAHPAAVQRFGIIPQVMPIFASQALYYWESNTRSATIIGAVGAGGIGLKLWEAMRTNSDWENVAYMVLLILIVVYVFDTISGRLRSMLMGQTQH
jgi:phosphonate transport system permease protein